MCGRFNFTDDQLEEIKGIIRQVNQRLRMGETIKTGEIYPTNLVPILLPDGAYPMTWGYPHFKGSGVIINARAETVTDKRMFKGSVLTRRCIIPSTGFYEWDKASGSKQKNIFTLPGENVLYMAGCYQQYKGEDTPRFVILTTEANESIRNIHDRMPVVLRYGERASWLKDGDMGLFDRKHVILEHVPV